MECDEIFNAKLLHQVECLTKVVPVLPQMIDTNPLHWNTEVVLGLDHTDVYDILLLGPEQLISSKVGTRSHVGIDLPTRDKLSKRHLIHTHGGFLLFGGGGLGSALGGIGALCYLCVAHTLGSRVTAWIGAAIRST